MEKTLYHPPFPPLTWEHYFWVAELTLPSWAGFQVRHQKDLRPPRHRGFDALDLRGVGIDRVVECERAVQHGTGDLASLGHLAKSGRIDRRGDFRRDGLNGR